MPIPAIIRTGGNCKQASFWKTVRRTVHRNELGEGEPRAIHTCQKVKVREKDRKPWFSFGYRFYVLRPRLAGSCWTRGSVQAIPAALSHSLTPSSEVGGFSILLAFNYCRNVTVIMCTASLGPSKANRSIKRRKMDQNAFRRALKPLSTILYLTKSARVITAFKKKDAREDILSGENVYITNFHFQRSAVEQRVE